MADIFSDIGKTVGQPIGNLWQGFYKGIAPGAFQQAEIQQTGIKRKRDMEQFGLYLNIMKDRTGTWSPQAKKAAADSMRRSSIFKQVQERLGGAPVMGQGWAGGMGTGLKGMEAIGAKVNPITGELEYQFEKPGQFGDIPGAIGLLPEEERPEAARKYLFKPETQINLGMERTTRAKVEDQMLEAKRGLFELERVRGMYKDEYSQWWEKGKHWWTGVREKAQGIPGIGEMVGKPTVEDKKMLASYRSWFGAAKSAFLAFRRWATGVAGGQKEMEEIATAFADPVSSSPTEWKALADDAITFRRAWMAELQRQLDLGQISSGTDLTETEKTAITRKVLDTYKKEQGTKSRPSRKIRVVGPNGQTGMMDESQLAEYPDWKRAK